MWVAECACCVDSIVCGVVSRLAVCSVHTGDLGLAGRFYITTTLLSFSWGGWVGLFLDGLAGVSVGRW